ncbi:MAG: CAP domain-containing protein, partial [Cyanobacteria bacterium J06638_6]
MDNTAFVKEVIDLTNEFRAKNGLDPLSVDVDLTEAAQKHSASMAKQDFFSHTGPNGSKPKDRAKSAGYETQSVGENIAAGYRTPQDVVDGWIASSGHRRNMLNSKYNEIGV